MAQKTFTFKQYRTTDLIIFAVILCVLEAVIGTLANKWVDTLYFVSLFYAVIAIVLMRWGAWGAFHCVAGAVVQCAVNGADVHQWAAYIAGNCFALLALLLTHFAGKKRVRDSVLLTLCFVAIVFVATCFGRAVFLAIFKHANFWDTVVMCFTTDLLSVAIAIVIVLVARKQNGLFEDQKDYLTRTNEQRQKELQKDHKDII